MGRVSDYSFINAKLRARIGIMHDPQLVDSMIKAPSLTEAVAKLDGTRYQQLSEVYRATGDLQQVELALLESEIANYREVMGYLPQSSSSFVSVLLEKVEIDNIKNAIRLWYSANVMHHSISYRSAYIYKSLIVHPINYDAIINAGTYSELAAAFHGTPYSGVLSSFTFDSLAASGLFPLEIALDHKWFSDLESAIGKLSGKDRQIAEAIYSVDVDLKNILMITRYSYSYHLDAEHLASVIIPMGYIAKEIERRKAALSDDPVAVIREIIAFRYPQIIEEIAHIRRTSDDLTTVEENNREIVRIEEYLGERRKKEYNRILTGDPFTIGVVLSYFFICASEESVIRAVLSGKYYRWSEDKIRERLGL